MLPFLDKIASLKGMRPLAMRNELDDLLLSVFNAKERYNEKKWSKELQTALQNNAPLKNKYQGQRCFIIGNGPSINQQDLTDLKDEITFVVNRFPHHELAAAINPTFYVSVDPKFASGEWGTDFIEQLDEKLPNVHCFLSLEGKIFVESQGLLKNNPISVIQPNQYYCFGYEAPIDLTRGIPGKSNVTKSSLAIALYMGISEINLIGIDGNGLIKSDQSHFYGHEPQPTDQLELENDLISMSLGLRGWRGILEMCEKRNVRLQSINPETVLSAIPRGQFPGL